MISGSFINFYNKTDRPGKKIEGEGIMSLTIGSGCDPAWKKFFLSKQGGIEEKNLS